MDCLDARHHAANDEKAAHHVATCKVCNAVVAHPEIEGDLRAFALSLATVTDGDAWWPSLQTQVAADRGPRAWLRSLPRARVTLITYLTGLAIITSIDALARGPHWDRWPLWHQLATLVGGSLLLGGGLTLGLRSVFEAPSRIVLWATGAAAMAAGVLLALTPDTLHTAASTEPFVWTRVFIRQAWGCFRFGLLCTVPILAWLAASWRWQPERAARRFAVAASAALVGMLGLEVHCPALDLRHRLVGHAALGVVLGLLALAVGAWRGHRPGRRAAA